MFQAIIYESIEIIEGFVTFGFDVHAKDWQLQSIISSMLATLTVHLHLPACTSLKEKRGRLKPLIARLHREFNVSVAEMERQDMWQEAVIVCAMVGNGRGHLESALQSVAKWIEGNWTDGDVIEQRIEVVI
ncbi:MAG TPA: DUF503 domain-containing protein [Anaerolineales bacterium]|nr:DUF503 domain-containing protein [Anaerolineales bacterium]